MRKRSPLAEHDRQHLCDLSGRRQRLEIEIREAPQRALSFELEPASAPVMSITVPGGRARSSAHCSYGR